MRCAKPATYHITDIEHGRAKEHHFCEEHARQHLAAGEKEESPAISISDLASSMMKSGLAGAGREPLAADAQVCPSCQLSFLEFRNSGRLGCPHDYEAFRDDLMPLLEKIHDETRHCGKTPKRAPRNSEKQTQLIEKRNQLKRAVAVEDFEAAARLRDEIKFLEQDESR
jgi:protein arginine kinase activator